jgi:tetratricopeptide (TPR) repeat protein
VSEETEGQDTGAEAVAGGIAGVTGADPFAAALALGGASREEADAFLKDQRAVLLKQGALIDDQRHYVRERYKQLVEQVEETWLRVWSLRLSVLLRLATAAMGLAIAAGLALMMWGAAHSNGLKVEPFSVPPDLAQRGLTGQVVAARVIDRLNFMQSHTNTARPARSYSNSWDENGIKLEIPQTGVSIAELNSWLREKIGNDTYVTGEVVRTATGITVTARTGEQATETVSGADADVDALVAKTAEAVYRITQPFRYAIYLMRHENRPADATPIFQDLALHGSPADKLWSYPMWGSAAQSVEGNTEVGIRLYKQALDAYPTAVAVFPLLFLNLEKLGRTEEALKFLKDDLAIFASGKASPPSSDVRASVAGVNFSINRLTGAYHDVLPMDAGYVQSGRLGWAPELLLDLLIRDQIGEHDISAARARVADYPKGTGEGRGAQYWALQINLNAEEWTQALRFGDAMAAYLKAQPHDRLFALANYATPLALAQAHLGDFAAAERTIAPTPDDCYRCLIARALIAELQGQHARADWWFKRADDAGPSLSFAFYEEGKVLLARGKPDDAMSRFTIANKKSPHYADALEGWGEALTAKNESHLALAKFAEADKYAPNWGRLHLKWGEALFYAGQTDQARAQFQKASTLNLTAAEKAELAWVSGHV